MQVVGGLPRGHLHWCLVKKAACRLGLCAEPSVPSLSLGSLAPPMAPVLLLGTVLHLPDHTRWPILGALPRKYIPPYIHFLPSPLPPPFLTWNVGEGWGDGRLTGFSAPAMIHSTPRTQIFSNVNRINGTSLPKALHRHLSALKSKTPLLILVNSVLASATSPATP